MAQKQVCKVTWVKSDPLAMASQGETSVTKMTSNSSVPTPTVPLSDMTAACSAVRSTYPTRLGDDEERIAFTNAVTNLDEKLHLQITYVDECASGDPVIIIGCGFTPTSLTKTRATITEPITAIKLTPKSGGNLKLYIENLPIGCKSVTYVIFTNGVYDIILDSNNTLIIPDGAKGIRIIPKGKAKQTVRGLSTFTSVSLIAYSVNAAGMSAPSGVFSTKLL